MKITKAIQLADILAPNKLPTELKVHYLSEVEGMAAIEVMMLATADVPVYSADDTDVEMLVKPPHDKIYVDYLVAMIHFANGEMNKYANTFGKFNESMAELHRFYFKRFHPADGGMVNEGYYISAYAIAVKHGYTGTEEEFAEMLMKGGGSGGGGSGGVGIERMEQITESTVDGGVNVWRAYLTDDTTYDYKVRNGSKGSPGYTPQKGIDYFDGDDYILTETDKNEIAQIAAELVDVPDGPGGGGSSGVGIERMEQITESTVDGGVNVWRAYLTDGTTYDYKVRNGSKGSPGYTPQKGIDYFDGEDYVLTETDKNEIAQIAAELVDVPDVPGGGSGGLNLTLLWENGSPQSSFGGQTITLSGNTANKILIQFITHGDTDARITYAYCNILDGDNLGYYEDENYNLYEYFGEGCVIDLSYGGTYIYRRAFRYFKTSIYFGGGERIEMARSSVSQYGNDALKPMRIYAIS